MLLGISDDFKDFVTEGQTQNLIIFKKMLKYTFLMPHDIKIRTNGQKHTGLDGFNV